ncbi:MAG TPA: HAMP domain-containing sensor histidine kinase [Puia sp.]|nr:HAMP domain-containing sensor histidine kinase [Puia sp.]
MKLQTKLTLFQALSKTIIVILFILLLPLLVTQVISRYTNHALQEQKEKVLKIIARNGIDYYLAGDSSYGSYTMLKEEYISLEPASPGVNLDSIFTSRRLIEGDTLTYRVLSYTFPNHGKKYLLEIGKTLGSINQYTYPLQKIALYVLISLVVLTLLADLIYTRILLRPLDLIIQTKIRNRKFPFTDSPVPVRTGTTDFRFLDDSLSGLETQIRSAFDKEREFTSNASHELMTPIGILQNKLENLMLEEGLDENIQEKILGMMTTLERLKKIVRILLLISRIDNNQFLRSDQLDIYPLLQEIGTELADQAEAKHIQVSINLKASICLYNINRELIFQCIFNLWHNAIRHNRDHGSIELQGRMLPNGGYLLTLEDSGIGIAAGALPYIFNRFRKARESNGEGYGLGLSIVKSIADYHGIRIDVTSELGVGSTFSLYFPGDLLVPAQKVL